ncbi:MAG: thioredoxin domain-containing protein [Verrucomicrobia bacterium]|nr:thioredoxin domain-containing protein [Verrucomicrobiota bacterium]
MSATSEAVPGFTNRLVHSNSPYLLQHAHNPVDWYAWGDEARDRAHREGKPIFLSIGYSACHWCHVMAHESFENERIAEILNRDFICIKVDREERPDIDEIYMRAVQLTTGSGGWPLSAWLTPDLKPFYLGTYFPPADGLGRPGFGRVLQHLATFWKEDRAKVEANAERLATAMRQSLEGDTPIGPTLDAAEWAVDGGLEGALREAVSNAKQALVASLDSKWGGFGEAPKFPPSGAIRLLLRDYYRTGDEAALEAAALTLDRMAYGGLFDQIGGGFHRYAVDNVWLVPHFEKMLYDNALLAVAYAEAFQLTDNPLYQRIATATLDYVLREMVDCSGGFHAAEDADSEGHEGKYYVWSIDEVEQVLGKTDGRFFAAHYGMTRRGNFEGHNILNVSEREHEDAALSQKDAARIARLKQELRKHRHTRTHPGRDDKVLAAWNGLMITAFAKGYQAFGDPRYRAAALRTGKFLRAGMLRNGKVLRSYRNGVADIPGYLDDYAALGNAWLDLYEISFDAVWLEAAENLMESLHGQFQDGEQGAYCYTAEGQDDLIARTKPLTDSQVPAGNTLAAHALLRLGGILGKAVYRERAAGIMRAALPLAAQHPRALPHMLLVMDAFAAPQTEILFVGPREDPHLQALCNVAYRQYGAARVIFAHDPGDATPTDSPLLAGRTMVDGKSTVFLCHDAICRKPMTSTNEFATVLGAFK